jgi:methylenetetrahydrofolate dehydrogenase (NADP+)/methenyltetrahydrofolate cyclohydrolase
MAVIMDGRGLAGEIKERVRAEVERLRASGVEVGLALMLIGAGPASKQYFLAIKRSAVRVGINVHEYRYPDTVSLNEILNAVHEINRDERINGLLALFPLPARINARRVVNAIAPEKDIDGLGAISVGRLAAEESVYQLFPSDAAGAAGQGEFHHSCIPTSFLPCTPFGVIRLLEHYGVTVKGKNAVILGKSLAVGKPLSLMLLSKEATVSVCHKATLDLASYLENADIVCTATGVPGLITGGMIKAGAVVVDIGINVMPDGSIRGDLDFDSVAERAGMLTPVPGGVGPVTISMLLENTMKSARRNDTLNSPLMMP